MMLSIKLGILILILVFFFSGKLTKKKITQKDSVEESDNPKNATISMIKPTFYYLIPKYTDHHGLTHGYEASFRRRYNVEEEFDQYPIREEIKSGLYKEGPPRLYEIPRFNSSIFPLLLVSENIKELLSQFELPEHRYSAKKLEHYKLTTETQFFLLQLKENTLLDNLDWQQTEFFYTVNSNLKAIENRTIVQSEINNKEDLIKEQSRLKKELDSRVIHIHPVTFPQKEQFDIVTYNNPYVLGKVIMVADYVKAVFEKYYPDQVDFIEVKKLDIRVNRQLYLERKQSLEKLTFRPNRLQYEIDSEFLFYSSKMARLSEQEVILPDRYGEDDEFKEIEQKLKKIFPIKFKEFYRRNSSLKDFELETINNFHIESNYEEFLPQTFGAVIFAIDGTGEGLGLLLKKESDYELGDQWYYFSHEDGSIYKVMDLSEYINH